MSQISMVPAATALGVLFTILAVVISFNVADLEHANRNDQPAYRGREKTTRTTDSEG